MPGNIVIKPIEANLTRNAAAVGRMNPYYVVALGDARQKGQVCKKGGKSPAWTDAVTVEMTADPVCTVELRTKRALLPDKTIGSCKIMTDDLTEERSAKWYDIIYKNKVAGKILIEANLLAGEGQLVGQNVQPLAAQSANALDERNREPILAEQNERNVASLGELPVREEGHELRAVEPVQESEVPKLVQEPVVVQDSAFVGVGEDYKHIDKIEDVKEMGHGVNEVKVIQGDNVFDESTLEIPEERTAEEGIQRVDADQLTRQR